MKPATLEICDFVRTVGQASFREYAAACPFPVLLELPLELRPAGSRIELTDAAEETLATVRVRLKALVPALPSLRVHVLVPGQGGRLVVGSGPSAGLALPGASPRHAELHAQGGCWRIRDLESAEGTRIEGSRIPVGIPIPLVGGQAVRFGAFQALFLDARQIHGLARLALQPEPERLSWPSRGLLLKSVLQAVARSVLPGPETGPYLLQVPVAAQAGPARNTELTQDRSEENLLALERSEHLEHVRLFGLSVSGAPTITVGRGLDVDVVLDDASVSRHHATLTRGAAGWQLVDLESQNGTYLQGQRLHAGIRVPVRSGQTLQFGGFRCVLLDADELCNMLRFLERRVRAADPLLSVA